MNYQTISLIRGQAHVATVRLEGDGGVPFDLSTASAATFTATVSAINTTAKITKELGSGLAAGAAGYATITLGADDTSSLISPSALVWTISATVDDMAAVVAKGSLSVAAAPQVIVREGVDQVARDLAGAATTPDEATVIAAAQAAAAVAAINMPARSAMTGDVVLTSASAQNQWLVPDADHAVTLRAEVAGVPWVSTIHHAGSANAISVKRASAVVVASLIAGSTVTVVWDGTAIGIL